MWGSDSNGIDDLEDEYSSEEDVEEGEAAGGGEGEAGGAANSLLGCPDSLRDCLAVCSPVISINQLAYKLCINECLDRC